jgi:hypothetical protein
VIVDAGTDEKNQVAMGSGQVSYPVIAWSKSGGYEDVVIEYSQDCAGLLACELADVTFSQFPADVNYVLEAGNILLTGDYAGINKALKNLIITPGVGNPSPINVKVTATDQDSALTATDSFVIPILTVSLEAFGLPDLIHFDLSTFSWYDCSLTIGSISAILVLKNIYSNKSSLM